MAAALSAIDDSAHAMTEFWAQLTAPERLAFTDSSSRRRWRRRELLFRQGDDPGWVALLHTGHVKVSSYTAAGVEVVLAICGPGTLIGDVSALDGQPRSATVEALEDVTVLLMPRRAFDAYLHAHSRAAGALTRTVAQRLRDADKTRIEMSVHSTADRLAARLVDLAERFGTTRAGTIHIELHLSQDDLARWAGSSREAATKTLAAWRRQGWIETGRRSVAILNLSALHDYAQHAGLTASRM